MDERLPSLSETPAPPSPTIGEKAEPVIRIDEVTKVFSTKEGSVTAMDNVSLDIESGEFIAVVGPSGCGKTSLLRMVAGLVFPSSGKVEVNGKQVDGINTDVGFVTQDSNLFPWMTLIDNVMFPLKAHDVPKVDAEMQAREMLALVGLAGFENRYPHELSGGMQKRGSIARTMVYHSEVVLMDEPFGPLDAQTRGILQTELLRIWENSGRTVMFVTHDLVESIALSDRVAVMSRRPGVIKEVVTIDLPRPRDPFEIQAAPGYAELQTRLWDLLRDEIVIDPLQQVQ